MNRRTVTLAALIGGMVVLLGSPDLFADSASTISSLGLRKSNSVIPSIWRIILSFGFVVVVGIVALWATKRFFPKLAPEIAVGAVSITVLARKTIVGGLTLHIVDVDGQQLAITNSRHGIDVTRLSAAADLATPTATNS